MKAHHLPSLSISLAVSLLFVCGGLLSLTSAQSPSRNDVSVQNAVYKEKLYLHLDKPFYAASDTIWFCGHLVNGITHQDSCLSNFIYVELFNQQDSLIVRRKIKRDADRGFQGCMTLPVRLQSGNYYVRAYTRWMQNEGEESFYTRNLSISNPMNASQTGITNKKDLQATDFAISFFPEGGPLLAEKLQKIAFKAQGDDGFSAEVTGIILNQHNDTLLSVRTEHDGMGSFVLKANPGDTYVGVFASVDGSTKRFSLPIPEKQGRVLNVARKGSKLYYTVLEAEQETQAQDSLFLCVQARSGELFSISLGGENRTGMLSVSSLPEGIIRLQLVSHGQILSERLVLIQHPQACRWIANMNLSEVARQKQDVELTLQDEAGQPLAGNFSISVTDAATVASDRRAENIRSSFLLTSELKGFVENPGYYFHSVDALGSYHADLLMMTHGWRNYVQSNLYPVEQGQYLSGRVNHALLGTSKPREVTAFAPSLSAVATTTTDKEGVFFIEDIDFQDSTQWLLTVKRNKVLSAVEMCVDRDSFPPAHRHAPFVLRDTVSRLGYLSNIRQKYFNEGGERNIDLPEVLVGTSRKESLGKSIFAQKGSSSIRRDKLDKLPQGRDVNYILQQMRHHRRGVKVAETVGVIDDILYVDSGSIKFFKEELALLKVEDIERIDILTNAPMFGERGAGGALIIETRRAKKSSTGFSNTASIVPLGYALIPEFYHPVYTLPNRDVHKRPDLRSTLYWNPSAKTDKEGKIDIHFYSNDYPNGYVIEVEGVTRDGRVLRFSDVVNK